MNIKKLTFSEQTLIAVLSELYSLKPECAEKFQSEVPDEVWAHVPNR